MIILVLIAEASSRCLVFPLPLPGKRSFLSIKLSLINILRDGLYSQKNILLNLDHISERLEELKPSPEALQYFNDLLKILHLSSVDGGLERSYWWSSEPLLVSDLEGTRGRSMNEGDHPPCRDWWATWQDKDSCLSLSSGLCFFFFCKLIYLF